MKPIRPVGEDGFAAKRILVAYECAAPGDRITVNGEPARVMALEWRADQSIMTARIFRAPTEPGAIPEFEEREIYYPVEGR